MATITGRNEVVAKVMFLLVSVILSTGGSPCKMTPGRRHPPARRPPWKEAPPGKEAPPCKETPPQKENPPARRPPGRSHPPRARKPPQKESPPGKETPWEGDPPIRRPPPGIRSMSGRYASYWNAILFTINIANKLVGYPFETWQFATSHSHSQSSSVKEPLVYKCHHDMSQIGLLEKLVLK